MNGFELRTKALQCDNLPLNAKEILRAMECSNKIMSEKEIKLWIDKYSPHLFWKQDYYILEEKERRLRSPQLYPHEFVYLIANARDRLAYVTTHLTIDEEH